MLGRISFYGQQINGYGYEFVMLGILFLLIIKYRLKPLIEAYKKNKYLFWFFIFNFLTFFISISRYSLLENLVSFLYQIRLIYYFIFFFYIKNLISKKALDFFIILTAIISLVQYFLYPDLRNLIYAGWDPHLYRMFGTYLDTYVAVAIYGLVFFYLFFQKRSSINKILLVSYFFFIIMTFSRLGYLSFLLTFIFIYIRDLKKFLIIFALASLVLFLLPKPQGEGVNLARIFSIQSRVVDYQKAVKIWQRSPLIGIGYNRIRYIKNEIETSHSGASFHSSFMIVLATTGIIGFILFLLGLIKLSECNSYGPYFLIFVSLISLGDNAFLHPFILFLLLSFISLNPSRR